MQMTMTVSNGPAILGIKTMSGWSTVLAGLAVYETARSASVRIAEARTTKPAALAA